MRVAFIHLIFLLLFLDLSGQEDAFLFKSASTNNGLSHNQINCFLRDKKGFLWIGTKEGLSRFDGFSFKNFIFNPRDSFSLKDNFVSNLFEAPNGNIWITAGDYFNVFDPVTESFTTQNSIFDNRIAIPYGSKWMAKYDHDNNLIFVNDHSGIFKYITAKKTLIPIKFPTQKGKKITSMATDGEDNIWITATNGILYKISQRNYQITDSFQLPVKVRNNLAVVCDNTNNLWIFDRANADGIYLIRDKTRDIQHITSQTVGSKLSNNAVSDICEGYEGNMWVAIAGAGIHIIDKQSLSIHYLKHNPLERRSINGNNISVLYGDSEGIMWLGSNSGLSYHHKNLYKFHTYRIGNDRGLNNISCAAEDLQGNLWLGTYNNGLIYYNRKDKTFKQYIHNPSDPGSIGANTVKSLLIDKDERLWIGTSTGLNLFTGNRFEPYNHSHNNLAPLSNAIEDICEDADGELWIATNEGVSLFDPEQKKMIQHFRYTTKADSTIQAYEVFSIIEDRDNILWFATQQGLRSFDKRNNKWEYFNFKSGKPSISSNHVKDVFEDSRGFIWAATNHGLNKYNKATKDFSVFTTEEGLPSNLVLSIAEDNQHAIWLATSNGLSNLTILKDHETRTYQYIFSNYNRFNGLQGNDFNERASLKTHSGEIFFGGPNGFNLFNPLSVNTFVNSNTKIILTDFFLFGQRISNNSKYKNRKILTNSITYTNEIELKYTENIIAIGFSTINFFWPEQRKFKYMLENFSDQWIEISDIRPKATFTNLNPGKYILRVKTTNIDGTWNDNSEVSLTIRILPPWWNSLLFKIFAIGVVIFILYYFFAFNYKKLKLQNATIEGKLREQSFQLSEVTKILDDKQDEITLQHNEIDRYHNHVEEIIESRTKEIQQMLLKVKESDGMKSAFLANMSYEIRTPMNAIVGFASLLKNDDLSEADRIEFIDIINQNCASLLVLINDIMDISKIESNQINIVKSPFLINSVLEELETYYKLNNIKNIEISYVRAPGNESVILHNDTTRFRQVVSNLLSNAYRFTEQGYIKFGFEILNSEIKFYVSDSGIGIKESNFEKIFDHLQKVKEEDLLLQGGSGLGLPISRKLLELMGGKIWLESKESKGSTFYFTLPFQAITKQPKPKMPDKKIVHDLREFTILIAEDEPANYFLIDRILKSTFANTIWAKNGKEAVDFISGLPQHKNIIVLMDIKMPVMNGIDALRNIRQINKDIPVIAVTAYAYETEKLEIIQNDFNDYIIKPLKPEKLLDILGKYIS